MTPVMLNLIMAIIWLAAGCALLAWQALHPDNPILVIRGTGISFGWLAFGLAVYNLVRWWSSRSYRRQRRALEEEEQRRRRSSRGKSRPAAPVNPDFDFSDKPPEP